ncbi:unnamed protein product [Candidula unifasciata]|uniref:STAS domain-containing protein n=1 Tax=Candidula unifasciata TaxID=100452 RepID=A0A8S4A7B7_9EUPU|nr:unnamed protein product [Candidula unifasciata]
MMSAASSSADISGAVPRHVLVMPGQGTQVMISRAPFTQSAFDELHVRRKGEDELTVCQKIRNKCFCSKKRLWRLLTGYVPVIKFIRYYKFREYAIADIFAGLSIGTIHLPQGLAFGLLASAKIENGLFSSLWPSLVYIFFGTSPHLSMGTSAVICLLTASVIDREGIKWQAENKHIMANYSNNTKIENTPEYMDFKEEVAMGLTLIMGIVLLIMGMLRLGFITAYLSDSFFSAFTSAAAVHIGTTQLPPMLGITVPRFPGVFKVIYTYKAIFHVLNTANFAAIIIAIICLFSIWFVKEYVNEKYKSKMFAPIPIELFIVIFGTIASQFGNFRQKFGILVVGSIPTGLPEPKVPLVGLSLVPNYIGDAIVMAILTFAYTIALAKICAKKHNYQVDDSQEMLSYGILNVATSFLRCIPSCVAPPRTMVASSMNARTTLCGITSCLMMFLVIMVVASLFQELPKAVLGAIIFVSLKNLFIQIGDCLKYWRINKFDFLIWFFTFFCTVFIDIDMGLYIGVGISVLTVVFQTQFAKGYKLGYTKKDTALVVHKQYKDSSEIPGIKVFRFKSNLYYANAEIFRNSLYRKSVNPRKLLKGLKKREKRLQKENEERMAQGFPPQEDNNFIMTGEGEKSSNNISYPNFTLLPADQKESVYPMSILKSASQNGMRDLHSSPELPSLDSESGVKPDLSDPGLKPGMNGLKRVQLSVIEKPLFTIDGSDILNSHNSFHSLPDAAILKRRDFGSTNRLKTSESVLSLYSIDFDEYEEDPEDGDELITDEKLRQMRKIHHVIIDCSPINYIDASGTNVLTHIFSEYSHVSIKLYLAGCSAAIRSTMRKAGVFDKIPESHFFLDVHDAVSYAKPQRPEPIRPENMQDFTDAEAIENSRVVNA